MQIQIDNSRDALLTEHGKHTLQDRYLMPGETFQGLFARVASAYASNPLHAQRHQNRAIRFLSKYLQY